MPPTSSTGKRTHLDALAARHLRKLVTDASFAVPEWTAPSAWHGHAPFASWLVEAIRPESVVELGVYEGFSYFAFCEAARRYAPAARLVGVDTWEGDAHQGVVGPETRLRVEEHNQLYALRSLLVAATFDVAVERFSAGEIDLLHIDGLHTYDAVRHDFETWLPKLSSRGVVLLHDSEVRERGFGVWRLMDDLDARYPTFRFTHDHGLGVVGVGTELPTPVRMLLEADSDEASRAAVREAYDLLGSRLADLLASTSGPQPPPVRGSDRLRETLELRARLRASESVSRSMVASHSWKVTSPLRRGGDIARRWKRFVRRAVLLRVPINLDERRAFDAAQRDRERTEGSRGYANWIDAYDTFDASDLAGMRQLVDSLSSKPLISVVMPVFDPEPRHLEAAVQSLRAQVYENWQLCAADDCSTDPAVRSLLEKCARRDSRIDLTFREINGGISARHRTPHSRWPEETWWCCSTMTTSCAPTPCSSSPNGSSRSPISATRTRTRTRSTMPAHRRDHYFKPDWNPELLRSQNYLCHLSAFRTDLARQVGGFRSTFDGSQDWDLALRLSEILDDDQIGHIPHVLYHWRAISTSAASESEAKPYAAAAGRAAVEDHLRRRGDRRLGGARGLLPERSLRPAGFGPARERCRADDDARRATSNTSSRASRPLHTMPSSSSVSPRREPLRGRHRCRGRSRQEHFQ